MLMLNNNLFELPSSNDLARVDELRYHDAHEVRIANIALGLGGYLMLGLLDGIEVVNHERQE